MGLAVAVLGLACGSRSAAAAPPTVDADFRRAVEEDWSRQEQRWGRTQESAEALKAGLPGVDVIEPQVLEPIEL